jgi:periplasmic protein TonB
VASPASTSSRPIEPTGEPASSAHSSARPSGEAVAITVRDDFLLELGDALGGQIAVRPVDSFATALEHLSGSRRLQILLIDSRDPPDMRGDVERALAQMPHLPIVVFAPAESEKTVAGSLKSANIFAVLPIPVDPRKTAAILEGALADAAAKRGAARSAEGTRGAERPADLRGSRAPLVPEPASVVPEPAEAEDPPSRKGLVIAAILAALAVATGAGLYLKSKMHPAAVAAAHRPPAVAGAAHPTAAAAAALAAPTAAAAPADVTREAAQVPLVAGTVDELLEKARLAMRERRYTEPAGNSALLYYRSVLKVEPANGEARDGMARLASLLMSRFDDAMSAERYDEAGEAIADLKIVAPGDARVGPLEERLLQSEVNNAFAGGDADRAAALVREAQQSSAVPPAELAKWRAELARDQSAARASHLADLFNERIREGRLVAPANDSAKYYLEQLKDFAPQNAVAERGTRDLVAACLAKARDAAIGGRSGEAEQWVAEARAAGMTSAEYSTYQQDIAAARNKAAAAEADRLAALARDRMQNGELTSPASDSAVYYLTQLKSAQGNTSQVHAIGLELASSLIEQATAAARAGRVEQMSSDLAVARSWGADPALVQAVEQIVSGPPKAAPSSPPAIPGVPPGYVPKRIRYAAPEYPEAALDANLSGSVTVEFVVDLSGRPRDVRVVESKPRGTFDYAAVAAVSQWRFEPPPAEVPTRTVIRFAAPSN